MATAASSVTLCLRFPRVSCARARAPKDTVSMSCWAWRDSSSESYFFCISFADKNGSSYLTPSASTLSVLAVEASSLSESLAELSSSETSEFDGGAALTSSLLSYFNGLIRLWRVSARGIIVWPCILLNQANGVEIIDGIINYY